MHISRGVRLGPYEIVALLGAGGMGEVWRARDIRLDRDVAVKVLPAEFAANAQLRIRFEREARAISKLTHPNICALYDIGEAGGVSYLVMELLEGETLAERIGHGPLPVSDVLRIGGEIAAALEQAHRNRFIHRDLKPANVMLTKSGAKLLDFGLAKVLEVVQADANAPTQHRITSAGFVVGTPQYMAPEQISGGDVDHRSDIFALGAVLYEMTTGRAAFDGDSHGQLARAILTATPPPPGASPALDRVILKCLEKDPDDRWQSAHDVVTELRWIGSGAPAPAPVAATTRRRWWPVALIAAVAAIAIGIVTLRQPRPASYSFTIPTTTSRYEHAGVTAISPDGQTIVFIADDPARHVRMLWRRRLDAFDAEPVPGTEGMLPVSGAWWSLDGKWVLCNVNDKLVRVPAAGGPPQAITTSFRAWGAAMNRDGVTLFATGQGGGIRRVDPNGNSSPITKLDRAKFEVVHAFPTFLPDGKHFLFIAIERDPKIAVHYPLLYAGELGSAETRFLGNVGSCVQYVKSGHLLAVRDGALVALPFDVDRLAITGPAIPLFDSVALILTAGYAYFSASQTGILTALTPERLHLAMMGADGTVGASLSTLPTFSATYVGGDRTMLAFSRVDLRYGTNNVWLRDLRDGSERQVTFESTIEEYPVLTPDRSRVYYMSDRAGTPPDIYEKRLDTGLQRPFIQAPEVQRPRDCSPDGKWLLYMTAEDPATGLDLYTKRIDIDARPVPFVKTPASDGRGGARFSPDGRWVAYDSAESGRQQIYVKSFPSGVERQISFDATSEASEPRWSADGKALFFLRGGALWRCDFDSASGRAGEARRMFDFRGIAYEPTADGRFLVVLPGEGADAAATRVVVNFERYL